MGALVLAASLPRRCAFRFCHVLIFPAVRERRTRYEVKGHKRSTRELRERIQDARDEGLGWAEIARRLGTTYDRVYRAARRYGLLGSFDRRAENRLFCSKRHGELEHYLRRRELELATRPDRRRPCGFPPCGREVVTRGFEKDRGYCDFTCWNKARRARRRGDTALDECDICGRPIDRKRFRSDRRTCGKKACQAELDRIRARRGHERNKRRLNS